ncbi:Brp/Blh family beta-carotene 15,15'-dioxygenase [Salinivibrio socompensis]|uniref:Brp/Blh family beta-carotene 15,15'-dioxygenase n=1 Tax=Salinivibrio socompensis TaxID=1510206 RepID=UPI000472DF3A|nr:Brp/Blh family beta-carotene 15,15'-dioxygenase [Salinivibrio socompensis]
MQSTNRPPAFWLFPIGLVVALCFSALPGEWPLYVILAVSTALLGLPHGSLDAAVAKRHLPLKGTSQIVWFYLGYLTLGGGVLAIWWQVPNAALAAFLLYSAVHFADDIAVRVGHLGGTAYGLWVLSLPVTFHPEQVQQLFEMLGANHAAHIIAVVPYTLALGGGGLAICLALHPQPATSDWRDPLLLAAGAALLHPLAYFIAYWCFLHSPRHLELVARDLGIRGWRER